MKLIIKVALKNAHRYKKFKRKKSSKAIINTFDTSKDIKYLYI